MNVVRAVSVLALSAVLIPGAVALAQEGPAADPVPAAPSVATLKPGSMVRFKTRDGRRIDDRLLSFTADSLVLNSGAYALVDIDTVWQKHHEAKMGARTGAIIGGVSFGVLTGAAAGSLSHLFCESNCGETRAAVLGGLLGGAVGAVGGGLIGAVLGSAVTGWHRVYPVSPRDGGVSQR